MKMTRYTILITILCFGLNSKAQIANGSLGYYNDARLFSSTNAGMGSTARIQGIGGAQTSLGGDMSVIASNPAGIGFFNKSAFSFTPSLDFHESSSNYLGNNTSSFSNGFNFSNLGAVFYYGNGDYVDAKFKGGSLGVSINRTNNFKNDISYQGVNESNSIIDSYINSAGSLESNNLGGLVYGAFENYLIDPVYENGNQVGYGSPVFGNPRQTELVETSGSQYQINVAYGANYGDFFYFGAGIGIATINYTKKRTYIEDSYLYFNNDDELVNDDIINFAELNDKLSIEGAGINANLGVIIRPLPILTVGISYITPTFYALTDNSSFDLFTSWNGLEILNNDSSLTIINDREFLSDVATSDYSLRTPGKLNVGATFFLGKLGFVSGDVEFVDHSRSQLKSSDFEVFADNVSIDNLYTSVINYRLGVEFRIKQMRVRGGYAYYADPYTDSSIDASRNDVSFGLGYRNQDFFLDLAVVNRKTQDLYAPYILDGLEPVAEVENRSNTVAVTLGFNF